MAVDTMSRKTKSMVICLQNDYADVLQKNGHTYTGADGKTYNSGAYSIVHENDFVGNKWIPFFLGNNETTKGNCGFFCYSHSSYFAEVPEKGTKEGDDYVDKWGEPQIGSDGKYINHAIPELVKPNNSKREKYETNPF